MAEPHRVAVVGLGIGQMHVWSFRRMKDRYTVAAVCDVDAAKAEAAAERIGADVLTFDEVLARDDIDIVDLCTPPALHLEQIDAALAGRQGRHLREAARRLAGRRRRAGRRSPPRRAAA